MNKCLLGRRRASESGFLRMLVLLCLVQMVAQKTAAAAAAAGVAQPATKEDLELAALSAAATATASAAAGEPDKQEESYQRVYEAFTKLMENVSNNSLGNVRRLVSRLNQLVGGSGGEPTPSAGQVVAPVAASGGSGASQKQLGNGGSRQPIASSEEEKTEQILTRLDSVTKNTDQNTLRQLNEDVSKLVGTLSDSYLRNIRRVIERVNRVVGRPALEQPKTSPSVLNGSQEPLAASDRQSGSNPDDPNRQPGFPGWDELIVAVDRVQKSLASFVRSSTKLITSGRR